MRKLKNSEELTSSQNGLSLPAYKASDELLIELVSGGMVECLEEQFH